MSMELLEASPIDLESSVGSGDIECECMLCHLPLDEPHGPVEWRLTFRFTGPPAVEFGVSTMLMCDPCFRDWMDDPDFFGGHPEGSHRV